MSVATVERLPVEGEIDDRLAVVEAYANSLCTFRTMGAIAVGDVVAINPEYVNQLGFEDFTTAVAEMLKTDKELRETTEVNNSQKFPVVDGKARNKKGEPMVEVIRKGAALSAQLTEEDDRFEGQAERDRCDEIIVEAVDSLLPGETLMAVSYYPKDDLKKFPEIYKEKLGYEEYLAYVQIYSKSLNDTVTASSLSIEITDEAMARKTLADHGITIPEGESPNQWLKHYAISKLNVEEAKAKGQQIRKDYYEQIGRTTETISVNEYIESNQNVLRSIYDTYYPAIGIAVYTGKNNELLQSFAATLLAGDIKLKPEIKQALIGIANSSEFSDEQGHMMNSILRYAAAEEMRKGLAAYSKKARQPGFKQAEVPMLHSVTSANIDPALLLVQNIKTGVEAGRSYGGCAGNIALADKDPAKEILGSTSAESLLASVQGKLQEAFRGEEGEDWSYNKYGVCRIKGCKTRPGKTKLGPCSICKDCTRKDNEGIKIEDAGDEDTSGEEKTEEKTNIIYMSQWKKDHEKPSEPKHAEPVAA